MDDQLLGRARVVRLIDETIEAATRGQGGLLVVRGQPGSGRTALLREAGRRSPGRTLVTAGVREETSVPFAGLNRLLRPLAGQADTLAPAQRRLLHQVLGHRPRTHVEPLVLCSAVLDLLLAPWAGSEESNTPSHQPMTLLLVDDAPLLDAASAAVLALVCRRITEHPLAAIVVDTAVDRAAAGRWPGGSDWPSVTIDPLGPLDAAALADRLLRRQEFEEGDGPPVEEPPASLVRHLCRLAAGNPLAMHELVAALTDRQRLGKAPPPTGLPVGSRLLGRLAARIAGLPPEEGRLLTALALEPRLDLGTALRLARAVADSPADPPPAPVPAPADPDQDPDQDPDPAPAPDAGLSRLWAADLVRSDATGVEVADHLLRTAVLQLRSPGELLDGHRLLGEVLHPLHHGLRRAVHRAAAQTGTADATGSADELETEARRAMRSGRLVEVTEAMEQAARLAADPATAARRFAAAARGAWQAGDPARARMMMDEARALMDEAGSSSAAASSTSSELSLLRGEIELRGGTAGASLTALEQILDRIVEDPAYVDEEVLTALLRVSEVTNLAGDFARMNALAQRVRRLDLPDRAAGRPELHLAIDHLAGVTAVLLGAYDEANLRLNRTLETAEQTEDPAALVVAVTAAMTLGDERRAQELAGRAVEQARLRNSRSTLPVALEYLAFTTFWRDHHEQALDHAVEGLRRAQEVGQTNCAAALHGIRALVHASLGDDGDLDRARSAAAAAAGRGIIRPAALVDWASARYGLSQDDVAGLTIPGLDMHHTVKVMATPDLVEAARRQGRGDGMAHPWGLFERWAEGTGSPFLTAQLHRGRAALADDPAEAVEHLELALALQRERGLGLEVGRTHLMLGRALRRDRRSGRAREHLHEAERAFARFGAPGWAAQATAELRAAGVRPATRTTGDAAGAGGVIGAGGREDAAARLTPQQRQIARLVAQGATNREVAAELFISPRTVDHHLRNVYSTLGIRSRTELSRVDLGP